MKNILIGFLMATCVFLMIGATSKSSENGRYQAFGSDGWEYMIDAAAGEGYQLNLIMSSH